MKLTSGPLVGFLVILFYSLHSVSSFRYDNSVYNLLLKYAYITKLSYCIDSLEDLDNLTSPIVLKPKPFLFLQSGYDEHDYYGSQDDEDEIIELHVAKYLYPIKVGHEESSSSPQNTSAGFFAVDHRKNGTIILALRGSANARDYMTDINVATTDYEPFHKDAELKFKDCDNCKVHRGFNQRYEELAPEIFQTMAKLIATFPTYKLLITGHSLGGAIAILTGLELALLDYKPLVIGYGSPKVSNSELAYYIDKLFSTEDVLDENLMEKDGMITDGYIRVVHKGDYVPLLPPGSKFVQSGLEFFIECDDLPHPKSSVIFNGRAKEVTHKVEFSFWDLFSFDLSKIFHYREHSEYFYQMGSCDDLRDYKLDTAEYFENGYFDEEIEEYEDEDDDYEEEQDDG